MLLVISQSAAGQQQSGSLSVCLPLPFPLQQVTFRMPDILCSLSLVSYCNNAIVLVLDATRRDVQQEDALSLSLSRTRGVVVVLFLKARVRPLSLVSSLSHVGRKKERKIISAVRLSSYLCVVQCLKRLMTEFERSNSKVLLSPTHSSNFLSSSLSLSN